MEAESLPAHRFPPGDGPFGARGVLVSGIVDYARRRVAGGIDAVLADLPPQTRAFFEGSLFLASAIYDLSPVIEFSRAAAQLQGTDLASFARARAKTSAKVSVESLYKRQLAANDPTEMAARLPRIFGRFFEPCRAEGVVAEPGRMQVCFCELPRPMLGFYAWSCEGFVPEALRLVGATNVQYRWDEPGAAGDHDGIPLANLPFTVTWDSPASDPQPG